MVGALVCNLECYPRASRPCFSLRCHRCLRTRTIHDADYQFSLVNIANSKFLPGELVCLKFAVEGCNVAINYNSSADRAEGVVKKVEQDYGMKAFAIQGVCGRKYHELWEISSSFPLATYKFQLANLNNRICESRPYCCMSH